MATLNDLPDCVLVEIFSLLPVRERVRNSRVCHRWKRLMHDPFMWRHVDLSHPQVCPKMIWHVLRRYVGSSLRSLHLQGYWLSQSKIQVKLPALFKLLDQKCHRLKILSLHMADLLLIPMASLPISLRQLEFHSCGISLAWMERNEDKGALPHLEHLVLDRVPTFQDCHLRRLSCFPALHSLVLGGIYRLTFVGLDKGLQELSHLQRIEVLGCAISADRVLQVIRHHLRQVRHIRVTLEGLSAQGLMLLEGIPTLESLGLLETADYRDLCALATTLLSSCLTLPRLKVLELQGLCWQRHEADTMLRKGLSHCRVIVRAGLPQIMDWCSSFKEEKDIKPIIKYEKDRSGWNLWVSGRSSTMHATDLKNLFSKDGKEPHIEDAQLGKRTNHQLKRRPRHILDLQLQGALSLSNRQNAQLFPHRQTPAPA